MLQQHFKWMNLTDENWGEVRLLVPKHQNGNPWGILEPLRGTIWGQKIQVVSGSAFSDATRGSATRLMREIGPAPKHLCVQISNPEGTCKNALSCPIYRPHCRPGKNLPDCYEPPGEWTPEESVAITCVALAWAENRYVIVVEGDEW